MRSAVCSVIVAANNRLEHLAVAVASARVQLAQGVEVIALDDGSNPGVQAWLAARAKERPGLRIVETGGLTPPRARNAAIEAARAPLIAFLDPSCWWWPNKLAEQAEYHAAHPETAFSFTDYLRVSPDGEHRGTCFQFWQPMGERRHKRGYSALPNALQVALASSVIGTSTAVASKAALEKAQGFRDLPTAWESIGCGSRLGRRWPAPGPSPPLMSVGRNRPIDATADRGHGGNPEPLRELRRGLDPACRRQGTCTARLRARGAFKAGQAAHPGTPRRGVGFRRIHSS